MDALKIIPQAFFDLIARVTPGLVAILLLAWREPDTWEFIVDLLGRIAGAQPPGLPWWLLLGTAYIVGHLLSPATKSVQRITERYPRSKSTDPESRKNGLRRWFHLDSSENAKKRKPDSKKYDWLRVHSPDVGGISAKLRAEFTLYNALAAVLALYGIWSAAWHFQFLTASVLLFVAVLMAARGRETEDTMRKCVENFYAAATKAEPAPSDI